MNNKESNFINVKLIETNVINNSEIEKVIIDIKNINYYIYI